MSLHIAIDCRKAADLGIGRYIRGLVHGLQHVGGNDRFTLLVDDRSASLLPRDERFTHEHTSVGHYTIREPFAIGRIVERLAPDLFHAPHYVVPVTPVPCVVTIHDLIHLQLEGLRNLPRRIYARRMLSRAVQESAAILTVSEASAARIEHEWPQSRTQIVVTPNGVDEAFFGVERSPDRARPFLLYVGNDKPHKNLERLLDAWSRAARPTASRLVIAGSAPDRFADVSGVDIAGFVEDDALLDLLRGATALVLPSLEEGFGLPVAEAMAAGVPVLASRIPALVEITGMEATMFDPSDVDSIATAIARVFDGERSLDLQTQRARELSHRFSWSSTAETTMDVYRTAAASRS